MTKDELWQYAVDCALNQFAENFIERSIKDLLDQAKGSTSGALRLMVRTSDSFHLGNFGSCGPGIPMVECHGNAGSNPIEAWYPETKHRHNDPDLVIQWREVFEFVKAGRKRAVQLALF